MISFEKVRTIVYETTTDILTIFPSELASDRLYRTAIENEIFHAFIKYTTLELTDEKERVSKLLGKI
jgi:hypothetical protein